MKIDIQTKNISCPRLTFGPGRLTVKLPYAYNVISTCRVLAFVNRVNDAAHPSQVLRGLIDLTSDCVSTVLRDNSNKIRLSAYGDGVDDSLSLWQG